MIPTSDRGDRCEGARCHRRRLDGLRFCDHCRMLLLCRMRREGYLEAEPPRTHHRPASHREERDGPRALQEMALRVWEDAEGVDDR